MADDCTYSDLEIYGGTNVKTPNILKLSKEGITFNNAFVTMSMCTPSRAEFHTGLYPMNNGVCWNHSKAKPNTKSTVQYLEDLGYRTGIAGKIHMNPKSVFPFELIEGLERNCTSETADFETSGMVEFMQRDKDQPFCIVTALVVPHAPWTVGNPSNFSVNDLHLPPYLADTKETRESYSKYLAEIEVLDEQVGKTLDVLKQLDIEDNTIVLFTSEQGAQFPFCKWTNWNQGLHTSLIIRWPGMIEPNCRSNALVQYVDILPTLIELAGGEVSENSFDGYSFVKTLYDKNRKHREYAYFMHNNIPEGPSYPIRSISDGRYHYIRNLGNDNIYIEKHLMGKTHTNYWMSWMFNSNDSTINMLINKYLKRPKEELYDMLNDPYEQANLIDEPEISIIKERLSEELDNWLLDQSDPGVQLDSKNAYNAARKRN